MGFQKALDFNSIGGKQDSFSRPKSTNLMHREEISSDVKNINNIIDGITIN